MPMTACDHITAMTSASEAFVSSAILALRRARSYERRNFSMPAEPAGLPSRVDTDAAREPVEDQAAIRELREDLTSLGAEIERLASVITAIHRQTQAGSDEAPHNVLWQAATMALEHATQRVDEAASHLVRAASNDADLKRDWARTDAAVADLILALSKQASSHWERLGAHCAATDEFRPARRLAQYEKERKAIRELRTRYWWPMK
jgi:ADP-ribose pyrophosphatase YjhB (NUDIX family)